MQVLPGVVHGEGSVYRGAFSVEIEPNQCPVAQQEYGQAAKQTDQTHPQLNAKRTLKALHISLSVILCAVDAGAGQTAENRQVKDKYQLAGDGNRRHGLGALAADHDIVDQAYHIGNTVLNHHGNRQHQCAFINGIFQWNSSFGWGFSLPSLRCILWGSPPEARDAGCMCS